MNIFINELTWNKYAETIAMEDISEESDVFLPIKGEYIEESKY